MTSNKFLKKISKNEIKRLLEEFFEKVNDPNYIPKKIKYNENFRDSAKKSKLVLQSFEENLKYQNFYEERI